MADVQDAVARAVDEAGPARRRWTREEFDRAGDLGLFAPGERLELIGGEIIRKMTPQNTPHATATSLAHKALGRLLPPGLYIRAQLPLALGPDSEPEPDIAVVEGSIRDYETEHPSRAVLVVEVADTTLKLDRKLKASLYAAAGIPEYWIINLPDRVVECHRDPMPLAAQPFGHQYRSISYHAESETLACEAVSGLALLVADLLPRRPSERA